MLAGHGASAVFWGVAAARVVGKTVGIPLAALVVVSLGWGRLPDGLRWRHVVGGAADPFRRRLLRGGGTGG